MAQTKEGAIKCAAARIGMPVFLYIARIEDGYKWCTLCKRWHKKEEFKKDSTRADGLSAKCSASNNALGRSKYVPKPKPPVGKRLKKARPGDKKQARGRVNHLVRMKVLPDPDDLPCVTCGHKGPGRRHEYHHFKGYGADHHEAVEVQCAKCHKAKG